MKTGFIGILNNPSKSINSHSAGWNLLVKNSIDINSDLLSEKDDWNTYDRLIINHGVNFKPGCFNIIGGITEDVHTRIKKLITFRGELLQFDGFQMKDFLFKRKLIEYTYSDEIKSITINKKEKLLIGDSHSISIWPGVNWNIQRNDGKTLFGFLKNPTTADYYYFGNIDIRFHLPRQSNPFKATEELVNRYIEHAKENNAKVSCLLPIESENRKLPKSGTYLGKNYFGSRELRSDLVMVFNNKLISSGLEVNQWPYNWYVFTNYYEQEIMEPKQSVHIKPKYYANK